MKKNKLIVAAFAALAIVAAFPLSAAKKSKGNGSMQLKKKEVSFENQGGSLYVRNDTGTDVVLFVGSVEKDRVLGGVRAREKNNFDLKRISGIPTSGSLLLRAAASETYKGKTRVTEDDVIWTGLVVYDLSDSSDRIEVAIYKGVDIQQKSFIYVSNLSPNFVLELRKGTPGQGEVIATLPPLQRHKKVWMQKDPDGYAIDIYPTFIYVNPKTGEKTAMTGDVEDGESVIPDDVGSSRINGYEWNGPNSSSIGYKVAFINFHNDTRKTLEFRNGGMELLSDKGNRATPSGRTDTYQLDSMNGDAGQLYTALLCNITPNIGKVEIGKCVLKPGYVYDLTVTSMNKTYEYDMREIGKRSLVDDARISLFGE